MKQKSGNAPIEVYRHSVSHILASAVKELYPDVKLGIGPSIEDGFYYDFDLSHRFVPEDLEKIEKKMQEIVKKDYPFVKKEISKEEAIKTFKKQGEKYKVELLQEIKDEKVSLYESGNFTDLCRGPHVESTGKIKAFKLLRISGAYWRGSEKNPMLQRIYGTAFYSDKELKEYLKNLEEAEKRDHRKLGKELDLFSTNNQVGTGLILWHPKGALIRSILEDYWRQSHRQSGYQFVFTPHIGNASLWQKSGHSQWYQDSMYSPIEIDEVKYYIKPMNCPFHMMIYKNDVRSYRELPMRFAELGTVYRYERTGVLHGLSRVRGFTQDDAHIFCAPEQIVEEITRTLKFCLSFMKVFNLPAPSLELSVRDSANSDKYAGSDENWKKAEEALVNAMKSQGLSYKRMEGEAVFYGPKIDMKYYDALGRAWQGSTIQFDFNMPERFDLSYVTKDGRQERPYMIHRALYGSLERFFALLIEHYGGAFPVWLSPVQVKILPISEDNLPYAETIYAKLKDAEIRVELNSKNDTLGYKIREAEKEKVPYIIVLGKNEEKDKVLSVRKRKEGDQGKIGIEEFIEKIKKEIENYR
ncbi:MAG: threonine--tRNA ligase [Candidatus Ratteibacteria bacterium]|nr:threonine--tRNA ligase [Candidatus Ratteibacteria bacterium]